MISEPQNTANETPSYLEDLNPEQLEAVCHFEGPILVLAGAGSGKTRVLTKRVAHLVLAHGVKPWNILAVTFTNKATNEMRERLRVLLGDKADMLWAATFHSTGLRILRQHAHLLSYQNDFTVYDDKDSKALIKDILKECKIDEKRYPPQNFSRAIDRAKNEVITAEEYFNHYKDRTYNRYELSMESEVYDKYQRALLKSQAMDFGDLLSNTVLLFREHIEVLCNYQRLFKFVLVDEYQDTNYAQYELIKMITAPHKNLLVVGDDDQSIYAFRGATVENILSFEKDYPNCKVVKLEQNYRSTSTILDAAYSVIKENSLRKEKKLWTEGEKGEPIYAFAASDETEEADFVSLTIKSRLSAGFKLSDIAVFYRTNAQSRALEESLVQNSIPYRIFGGQKFYERKEIKDIVAYLRLIANESDDQALLRIINTPARSIGAQTVNLISKFANERNISLFSAAHKVAEKNKNVAGFLCLLQNLKNSLENIFLGELIKNVIEDSGYKRSLKEVKDPTNESRLENLEELIAIGRSMEKTAENTTAALRQFLDRVTLTSGDESPEEDAEDTQEGDKKKRKDAVTLMTLHLAKGLEFPIVFMTGMEEGLLPHQKSIMTVDPEDIEEERRLCYVGITRAMKVLYMTRAFTRSMFNSGGGFGGYREMSRFCYDIPEELIAPLSA